MAELRAVLNCRIEMSLDGNSSLHLNGSEAQLTRIVASLEERSIPVDYFGPGFRAADNGKSYDWFIRFRDSTVDPWSIVSCINSEDAPGSAVSLDIRAMELGARLAQASEALALAESTLIEQEIRHQHSLDAISIQAAMLRAAMEAQRERADVESATRSRLAKDVEKLASELMDLRARGNDPEALKLLKRDLDEALDGWQEAESSTQAAEAARQEAEEKFQNLQEALAKAHSDRSVQVPKGRRNRMTDLEASFGILLPNLVFLRDSLRFAAEQVFDLRALLTLLMRLNASSLDHLEAKKLRDANGWWECHFSTGQGRDGRLYYRLLGGGVRNAYQVMVSDKLAQNRDLDWLRRN